MFDVAIEAFDFRSAEYAELFQRADATAFQHPTWLAHLYDGLLTHNAATPLVVVVRRADRSLVLVLPLIKKRYAALTVVEFADLRVTDYVAPVAERGAFDALLADDSVRRRILKLLRPYDLLRIGKLSDGGLPLNRLFGIAEPERMATSSYAGALEPTFDAWRAAHLNASYGRELDKKSRQLGRKGKVEFSCVTDPAQMRETFEALKIFRRDRFEYNGGGELLQVPAYFEFYLSIAKATGLARTYQLSIDGRVIAGAMGLMHRGAFLVVLVGFTQTEFKNQSVGSLMLQELVRDCVARGDTALDFTIGDEPYKLIFGARKQAMWQVQRAGSPLGFAAGAMIDKVPAVKALARTLFQRRRDKAAPIEQSEPAEA